MSTALITLILRIVTLLEKYQEHIYEYDEVVTNTLNVWVNMNAYLF